MCADTYLFLKKSLLCLIFIRLKPNILVKTLIDKEHHKRHRCLEPKVGNIDDCSRL